MRWLLAVGVFVASVALGGVGVAALTGDAGQEPESPPVQRSEAPAPDLPPIDLTEDRPPQGEGQEAPLR